jgi:DNA-binding transcriptional regulator/RsmH inhibitor MraZ
MDEFSTRYMDNDSPPERFYAGDFRHSIDEKNRITIPSRWRRDKAEEFILLPEATHQFLLVMSPKEFARMSSRQKQIRAFPRGIAEFFCAICIHARSTRARTGKGVLFCPKSFAGRSD